MTTELQKEKLLAGTFIRARCRRTPLQYYPKKLTYISKFRTMPLHTCVGTKS